MLSRVSPCTRSGTEGSAVASKASAVCWASDLRERELLLLGFLLVFPFTFQPNPLGDALHVLVLHSTPLGVSVVACACFIPRARYQLRMDHAVALVW